LSLYSKIRSLLGLSTALESRLHAPIRVQLGDDHVWITDQSHCKPAVFCRILAARIDVGKPGSSDSEMST